ncbi:phosphotransferase family protein [Nocardioides solisilvae]|uniref:phosphotransferase family protein n=1 Tax=Nocardioides solisilvae TaxID=1542435 RepID=UPI000D74F902|nr:phosphotransferase family protein [Nocardioides solisilvae]
MTSELVPTDRLGPALVAATGDDRWAAPEVELISGGKSNLTFLLRSEAGELVLRRPPTGELLPSAHDMAREARVQQALAGTKVPVAPVVLVDDGDLVGIRCYVMEKVPGHIVRGELPPSYAATPAERHALGFAFADTLAHLHAVDHEAVGLGDYGRPEGFMARQVRRWTGQWEASRTHEVPEMEQLGRRLAETVPPQARTTLVHGDYRLDNVVLAAEDPGRINAVLDWELSTLGDPLTDVALLTFYWTEPGETTMSLIPGVTHLPGFPTRRDLLERYAATSGADLGEIDWYLAFSHFKFAAIAQGVQVRAKSGAMGGQDFGDLDDEIRELGHAGLALL